jgi:hypothetical protein
MNAFYSFNDIINVPKARKLFTEEWLRVNTLRFSINFKKIARIEEQISPKFYFSLVDLEYARQKVRLVHTLDDELVNVAASADRIISDLDLPPEHVLLVNKGQHSLRGQETIVTSKLLTWLRESLGPV